MKHPKLPVDNPSKVSSRPTPSRSEVSGPVTAPVGCGSCFLSPSLLGSSDAFATQVVLNIVSDEDCTSALFESIARGDAEALSIVGFILNSSAKATDLLVSKESAWLAVVAHLGTCDSFEGWQYLVAGFVIPAVKAELPVLPAVYDRVHALCRQTMDQHLRRREEIPAFDPAAKVRGDPACRPEAGRTTARNGVAEWA